MAWHYDQIIIIRSETCLFVTLQVGFTQQESTKLIRSPTKTVSSELQHNYIQL